MKLSDNVFCSWSKNKWIQKQDTKATKNKLVEKTKNTAHEIHWIWRYDSNQINKIKLNSTDMSVKAVSLCSADMY